MGPSKTPTKLEREWMTSAVEFGCVACHKDGRPGTPAEYHHIVSGNRRLGHLYGFGLCSGHHRDGAGAPGLVAVHPWKSRFERLYGTQLELLAMLKERLGIFDRADYEA